MHLVQINPLQDLSLSRNSVVRLTDCLDMAVAVYRGCTTTTVRISKSAQKYLGVVIML